MKILKSELVFINKIYLARCILFVIFIMTALSFAQMPVLSDMKVIDYGATKAAESYGSYADWDNDGKVDFINVENNNISNEGKGRFFKNVGTSNQPKYEFKEYITNESGKTLILPVG